jgi:hypothetical protein
MYNQAVLFHFIKQDYPGPVGGHQSGGQARAVGYRRRDVGRTRRQHRVGRKHGPPDHDGPQVPPDRIRRDAHLRLAARYLRLFGQHAADPRKIGAQLFPDVETVVERHRPASLRHLLLARHRRDRDQGPSDHRAGIRKRRDLYHLQFRHVGQSGDGIVETLRTQGRPRRIGALLWLWRRRRRADARDGRTRPRLERGIPGAPRVRLEGLAALPRPARGQDGGRRRAASRAGTANCICNTIAAP